MATTSLSLGRHWEAFIKREVDSGRYGSASEVVRDALRYMEERNGRLAAMRAHLTEGEAQALRGEVVADYSIDALLAESNLETGAVGIDIIGVLHHRTDVLICLKSESASLLLFGAITPDA